MAYELVHAKKGVPTLDVFNSYKQSMHIQPSRASWHFVITLQSLLESFETLKRRIYNFRFNKA